MPNYPLLVDLLLVLGSASVGGLLAKRLKQPIIFGYLFAGLFVSVIMAKFNLRRDILSSLAEIGLAFLMFSLGLEFSLKRIGSLKKVVLTGAFLQIVLTILIGTFLLQKPFGFSFQASLIISIAFSFSSTAIVVKILQERNKLESLSGEMMFGWLLIQDLAVLPLIGLLPLFSSRLAVTGFPTALFKAALVLIVTWFSAKKVVPKVTDFVTSFKSRELLLLFVVTLVFLFAIIVSAAGFSFALGAFLVGLVLSQVPAHFAIFSEIRPLRDVFLAIFFVSLGLSLDPNFIFLNIGKILLLCFLFLSLKIVLSATILSFFHYHAKTIFETSFGLAEVGEFAFVYGLAAFTGNSLSSVDYSLVVSVTLLTMVLTPWLFKASGLLYKIANRNAVKFPFLYRRFFTEFTDRLPLEELPFVDHVVILGYGRVGRWVENALDKAKVPCLVVEYNPQLVRQLKLEEKKVIFGDPSDLDVLDFAQVDKAKLVVLAIPDPVVQKMAITNCRLLNPKLKLVCRSHLEEDQKELRTLGVDCIVQPEFEAALSISHRVLQGMGFGKEEINSKLKEIKQEHDNLNF